MFNPEKELKSVYEWAHRCSIENDCLDRGGPDFFRFYNSLAAYAAL
jgi:hypothetical protein